MDITLFFMAVSTIMKAVGILAFSLSNVLGHLFIPSVACKYNYHGLYSKRIMDVTVQMDKACKQTAVCPAMASKLKWGSPVDRKEGEDSWKDSILPC